MGKSERAAIVCGCKPGLLVMAITVRTKRISAPPPLPLAAIIKRQQVIDIPTPTRRVLPLVVIVLVGMRPHA